MSQQMNRSRRARRWASRIDEVISTGTSNGGWGHIRSRVKALDQFHSFLSGRTALFGDMVTFRPLIGSINALDDSLDEILSAVERYASGESGVIDFENELNDLRVQMFDTLEEGRPDVMTTEDPASADAEVLIHRLWGEICTVTEALNDALKSVWDADDLGVPMWLIDFNRQKGRYRK